MNSVLCRERRCRWPLLVMLLLFVQVALLPVAHARPPDQIWIAGFYDGDDLDDSVLSAAWLEARAIPRFSIVPVWLLPGDALG